MKIAISSDFFTSLAKLPKTQMNKTIKLVEKFKNNPKSTGLNYEKLHANTNMYSIRVDGSYRCIIMKPDEGDVYILLWVDSHDNAYDWAKRHKCMINGETGSLQVIQVEYAKETQVVIEQNNDSFFSKFKDKELLKLGVPLNLLEDVKNIDNEIELDSLQNNIPEEVYEALFYILAGDSLEEVYNYIFSEDDTEEIIDIDDFAKALAKDSSQRKFYVVDDNDIDLMSMLNAPLEKWRVFLHPSQRKLIKKDFNGAVRVLGGAGTGKTVVAMHRAKWLAQKALLDNRKILFTTYTKNLSIDIYENLKRICDNDTLNRIEVKNIDQWVYEFLCKNNYTDRIVYNTQDIWESAINTKSINLLDFPDTFFIEEWERIIQSQSISNLNEYLRAKRIGRGTRLSRSQRKDIWEVFEEYKILMSKKGYKEPNDAMRDARILIDNGYLNSEYKSIIVDEGQDFTTQAFMLLRSLVSVGKNDLFIVGDAHQRIYGHKVVLGQCGINIRGRGKKLKLNYRTTEEIRKWAIKLFDNQTIDNLDDGIDSQNDYKSLYHGPKPIVEYFNSFEKEIDYILNHINKIQIENDNSKICIVVRTNNLCDDYKKELESKNISTILLSRNKKDDINNNGIRIATMHRVKGLEFDHVIIASVNNEIVPLEISNDSDEDIIVDERLLQEKSLLFVSATRAKKTLLVSSYGIKSEFL